jgi:hypothetical protein
MTRWIISRLLLVSFLLGLTFPATAFAQNDPGESREWIDLLKWSDGFDWGPSGINWNEHLEGAPKVEGITLQPRDGGRFPLPALLEGNYELEVEFTRSSGQGGVGLVFPVGLHNMCLELGAENGSIGGVNFIDGKPYTENAVSRRPCPVSNDERHKLVVRVQHDQDRALFQVDWDQAQNYFQWEGPLEALANLDGGAWKLSTVHHPWLTSHAGRVTFHKVRARPRSSSGSVRPDPMTRIEQEKDLKAGFVRLVGQTATAVQVGYGRLTVNQMPLEFGGGETERRWPLISRDFKVCNDFYGAHAASRLKCLVPAGAKSFSVVAYNDSSRTTKFQILVDGKPVHSTGATALSVIKIDLPPKASLLELVADAMGDYRYDRTYWCYPRYHAVPAERIQEKMLDGKPTGPKFSVASSTTDFGSLTHNQPIKSSGSVPVSFRDAVPCNEFVVAHAASTVTYLVPEGMTRFTAVGYNVMDQSAKFEVWADTRQIFESAQVGIVPIDVKLPPGTKTIELRVNDLGNGEWDISMWCYPRLYRK